MNQSNSIRAAILPFILENKLEKAFRYLIQNAGAIDKELKNQATLLHSRFNLNKKRRISGTESLEYLDMEFNRIKEGLLEFLDSIAEEIELEDAQSLNRAGNALETAMEEAGRRMSETTLKLNADIPADKLYLAQWLLNNQAAFCKLTAAISLNVTESKGKDPFNFKGDLVLALRFIFLSYIFDSEDWLDEPEFLFDFERFSKIETRVALLFFKYQICRNQAFLPKDKEGLILTIDRLDSSFSL